jgi:hypothetical protein
LISEDVTETSLILPDFVVSILEPNTTLLLTAGSIDGYDKHFQTFGLAMNTVFSLSPRGFGLQDANHTIR